MKRIFTSFILVLLSVSFISAQTSIGGIINSYAKVNVVDNTDSCNPFVTVDDASAFSAGDYLMIIQMKGAEMDTTNNPSFGNVTNLNSAGLYEKTQIDEIIGNDIYFLTELINNYDANGSVQIVSIPQYSDATVDSPIMPLAWDGDKGGVIAFEVENQLTMNANISASFAGFRGGVSDNQPSTCNWNSDHSNYFYPDMSPLGDSKGEGIADFYLGKENGRGAQSNGGGGGNDHNSGGGGGSNYGSGGRGGLNLNPTPLQCLGQYPGEGGFAIPNLGQRLYMGGGGGAGHENDGNGTDGGEGGGIVYIKANVIAGNWNSISAAGKSVFSTIAEDGAGGGGGGGTILLDANLLFAGLALNTTGGDGGDSNLLGGEGCMGPGGGGGGGLIFTDLTSPQLFFNTLGGESGVVTNSTSTCNGQTVGANNGTDGVSLAFPGTPEGNYIEQIAFDSEPVDDVICNGETSSFMVIMDNMADSYQWQIDNGSGYSNISDNSNYTGSSSNTLDVSNLPAGIYTIQCIVSGGCNDVLTSTAVTLEILAPPSITVDPLDQDICENDVFTLVAEATGSNVDYQWQVNDGSGFVNVVDDAVYNGSNSGMLTVQTDPSMAGYLFQCVVSNDCPGTSTSNTAAITIAPLPIPDFTFTVSGDTLFMQNTSTGDDDYYWDFGEDDPLEPGATPYHIYEEGGTYFVTIYAVNDCGTTSVTYPVNISNATSIFDTYISPLDFSIYPNPATDIVYLDASGETFDEATIRVFTLDGKMIYNNIINESIHQMDVTSYPSGTYLIQVSIENKSYTKKLMKK